jgi:hypothetical protein
MWPDWKDTLRQVQIKLNDGSIICGTLDYSDFFCDGESEFPLFEVIDSSGIRYSFADNVEWSFIDEN